MLGDGSDGVDTRALFLGGDTASHKLHYLFDNGVTSILSCKGYNSRRNHGKIRDQRPLRIENLIGRSDWRPRPGEFVDWKSIKLDIQELIYGCIHDGHNKYNHCHQGARRGACTSMFALMVCTRCTGDEAYEYIKGLRNIVETNCIEVCRKFSEDRAVWLEWLDDDEIVPLPCLVLPQEMQAIFQGKKHAWCRISA